MQNTEKVLTSLLTLNKELCNHVVDFYSSNPSPADYSEWNIEVDKLEDLKSKILKTFLDPSLWKLHEKNKLEESADDYFEELSLFIDDPYPIEGWVDTTLTKSIIDNEKTEKCIIRDFTIDSGNIGDNFYVQMITDPKDEKIVGYLVRES